MPARLLLIAAVSASTLFSSYDAVTLQLKAPFNQLFDRARDDDDFKVVGSLSYNEGGQPDRPSSQTKRSIGPVVATAGAKMYASPRGAAVCTSNGAIPVGTPVSEPLKTDGAFVQVMVLDALWHWAPPAQCPDVRRGPVWIERTAISKDFPK